MQCYRGGPFVYFKENYIFVYFKRNYIFKVTEGVQLFFQMLFSINTDRTCEFPGRGGPDPLSTSESMRVQVVACLSK